MSSTGVTIVWRRSAVNFSAAVSVYVGSSVGTFHYKFSSSVAPNSPDAFVRVINLAPRTKYFYTVCGESVCAISSAAMYFTTSPVHGDPQPVRMHVLGDPGKGYGAGIDGLRAAANFMGARPADFWIMNGDDAYNAGTDFGEFMHFHAAHIVPVIIDFSCALLNLAAFSRCSHRASDN